MLKVAFEGCCHGELDKFYAEVTKEGGADLVLIAGDFQSLRNKGDLDSLQVPPKYRRMGDFSDYYSGKKKAPYLTLVIGGNHEASNYLSELFYGGWLAPNIYYLGKAGSVVYKGLRISGISGIYKEHNFRKGHFEKPPYNPGDLKTLKKIKPYFSQEIKENSLGSPPLEFLLHRLKPRYWLAAHLHVHFEVKFQHQAEISTRQLVGIGEAAVAPSSAEDDPRNLNSDEISLDFDKPEHCLEEATDTVSIVTEANKSNENPNQTTVHVKKDAETIPDVASVKQAALVGGKLCDKGVKRSLETRELEVTHFIALDKCLAKRRFMKIIEIPQPDPNILESAAGELCYDVDWLAITKAFHPHLNLTQSASPSLPGVQEMRAAVKQAKADIITQLGLPADAIAFPIPNNFKIEVPSNGDVPPASRFYPNSQTDAFCAMLGIPNHNNN
ncbi:lariat debranching enzyme [Entomophthora muscae]|uniref:Lariat debranching enzyme n=1 Tax=Entomophthora muscae TaxID=34485 RepID=A0ACC2T5P0_9FUNG|nr:lariat debranching enzyme [Entomophthora muscae]